MLWASSNNKWLVKKGIHTTIYHEGGAGVLWIEKKLCGASLKIVLSRDFPIKMFNSHSNSPVFPLCLIEGKQLGKFAMIKSDCLTSIHSLCVIKTFPDFWFLPLVPARMLSTQLCNSFYYLLYFVYTLEERRKKIYDPISKTPGKIQSVYPRCTLYPIVKYLLTKLSFWLP